MVSSAGRSRISSALNVSPLDSNSLIASSRSQTWRTSFSSRSTISAIRFSMAAKSSVENGSSRKKS